MTRVLLLAGTLGVLAACGSAGGTSPSASSAGAASTTPESIPQSTGGSASSTTIATGATSLGTVLTDPATGKTLYYFTPEQGGKVVCAAQAQCNTAWPPEMATGTPTAPSDVTGKLGVVSLSTGGSEVTYNGWPLHTYVGDMQPGQTTGQGLSGKWFAATPSLTSGPGGSNGTPAAAPSSSGYGY